MDVFAPLSGVIVPLESNPDPVFARKLVGDGACIDPVSTEVLAPVAGRVTQLHPCHHALAITTEDDLEVLVHVGIDTISLRGHGFELLVEEGEAVVLGQPILRYDADLVARSARSLLTEVLVTDLARVERIEVRSGIVQAGVDKLFSAVVGASRAASGTSDTGRLRSPPVVIPNAEGLHARPAAVLAERARSFEASVWLRRGEAEANAKSVVSVLKLATRRGDEVVVEALGTDAQAAVGAVFDLVEAGSGELHEVGPAELAPVVRLAANPARGRSASAPGDLHGTPASPGLTLGRVVQLRDVELEVDEEGEGVEAETNKLLAALADAREEIAGLAAATGGARAEILGVQTSLLSDPDLLEDARAEISRGSSAAAAWQRAYRGQAQALLELPNPVLEARAADVRDIGRRVLSKLTHEARTPTSLPDEAVVFAEEVTPSQMAAFDRAKLAGLCTQGGSASSHVAILAKNLGVPMLCGIDSAGLEVPEGTRVLLDGDAGAVVVAPAPEVVARAERAIAERARRRVEARAKALAPAHTRDGHRVEVAANICGLEDAREAISAGAEGVGLLRSEFLFYDREVAPSEGEQATTYVEIAAALGPDRPFVVRTLDIGGDKPLAYLPLPKEDNPFLGLRGLRVSLAHPELLRTQLRAIARAAPVGNVRVMLPMVTGLDDLQAGLRIVDEELGRQRERVQVGAMVEVPSAAVKAERLAREVDFFSIGTNDLTQYTLAMDRGHATLARKADALHPAVLELIGLTVEGAHAHGRWVGVCGGLASDPIAVPALVGLGVDELSVSVPAIPAVKAAITNWSLTQCEALAEEVRQLATAEEVRRHLRATQPLEAALAEAKEG